jgi:hypothetical protein
MEKAAWKSLKNVTSSVLVDHKAGNYHDMLADLVQSCKARGYNVFNCAFLRLSFRLPPRKTQDSEQLAWRVISPGCFHHGKRYHGKWSPSMLADYCWTHRRNVPQAK